MEHWLKVARQDKGSVTAELAVTLPSVIMLLAIVLTVFTLQVQHLTLVGDAAMAARSAARGETKENAEQLIFKPSRKFLWSETEDFVCLTLKQPAQVAGLPAFELSERSCARSAGF